MKKSEAVVWFLGCYSIPNSFAPMLDIISFEPVCVCVCVCACVHEASKLECNLPSGDGELGVLRWSWRRYLRLPF